MWIDQARKTTLPQCAILKKKRARLVLQSALNPLRHMPEGIAVTR